VRARSLFGQVLQVSQVLSAVLRCLHLPQARQRAHSHRNSKQFTSNGIFGKLRVAGNSSCSLHHVQSAEASDRRDVAAAAHYAAIPRGIEWPSFNSGKGGLQVDQRVGKPHQVFRVRIGNEVEILGTPHIAMGAYRDAADDHEINVSLMEGLDEGLKVEIGQRLAAVPLIALTCLQSAWTRARRSLIGALRSAASFNSRALASSSMLPVGAFVGIVVILSLLIPADARASGIVGFDAAVYGEGRTLDNLAGSHPVTLSLDVDLQHSGGSADGGLRNLDLELPPGLLENPTAVPVCTQADFVSPRSSPWEDSRSGESCPDDTQVGTVTLTSSYGGGETRTFGLFNLAPPPGAPSELAVNAYGMQLIFVPAIRQAEGDYGLTLQARNVSQLLDVSSLHFEIWGTPWSLLHDAQRGNCLNEAEPGFGWAKCSVGRPAKNPARAYLTLPTSCEGPLRFAARAGSWQGEASEASATAPALEGCGSLDFAPQAHAALIDPRASSPSGYSFEIAVDTAGVTAPRLRAPAPVRKAVVQLPEGVTINPSVGSGLGVCSPEQYAAETPTSAPGAGCPNESKIGDFTISSPIVSGAFEGSIFLAAPNRNPFGGLLAVYLVAKNAQRGFMVKVAGRLDADPATGRLTATFDGLPQLPYSHMVFSFREGQRSPLATPSACGSYSTEADLSPWSDPGQVRHASLPLQIAAGIGGGPCPGAVPPFDPTVQGGSLNSQGGAYSPFYLHLARSDGEAEITSYSATFPPGLLGKLAGIPFCSDAAIAAAATRSGVEEREQPSCPEASRIGRTYSGFGVGPVLSYAPGALYLAGPYHGAQVSVVAINSAVVGPFDLGTIVIRSAIRIDATTAQASIDTGGSDPIPHIVKGIPIHLRDIRIFIDRPQFTVNPTSCDPEVMSSTLTGSAAALGAPDLRSQATASSRYQAFNCGALGFRPRISLRMRGPIHRAKRPSLRVVVRPRAGDANIGAATVTLPPTIFLNQAHVRGVCTRPQLAADRCPPGSAYGEAAAYTPLLDQPLTGKAYLVSSDNLLPDLVFALRGEGFAVNLDGRIDAVHGRLRATYATVPDAPVSKFVVRMFGARRGILENGGNLCAGPQPVGVRFLAHSNSGWVSGPQLKASCKQRTPRRKGGKR